MRFAAMERDRFFIGINYWPGNTGLYWWRMFASAQVKRDFSLLTEYRFDVVRIFLMWEDFQPEMSTVSVRALHHLVQVADTAHDCGFRILPTFFCGHMLGINWVPDWLVQPGKTKGGFPVGIDGKILSSPIRNMFTDREVSKAQKHLIHETTNALRGHPAIWGWDLGNQITSFAVPPSREQIQVWFEEMLNELKRWDAHLPVTTTLHHRDLESLWLLGSQEAPRYCDFLSIEALPPYPGWADAPPDPTFPVFLSLMTRWISNKDVILGSFGLPGQPPGGILNEADLAKLERFRLFSEGDAETHFHGVLNHLRQNGMLGALAWCFADLDSSLWDRPPFKEQVHERFYGLFRVNGLPKKAAKILSQFDRQRMPDAPDWAWIDMDRKEFFENPSPGLRHLYGRFKDWRGA